MTRKKITLDLRKSLNKYPKNTARAETTPRHLHEDKEIIQIPKNLKEGNGDLKEQIKQNEIAKATFELGGFYPFVFDALSHICTYYPGKVQRQTDKKETHYRVAIPIDRFIDFTLDGHTIHKKRLWQEMYKMTKQSNRKLLPYNETSSILTEPIRLDLFYSDGTKESETKKIKNLKNIKQQGKSLVGVVIEFYKPLFHSLLEGNTGHSWFLLPKAFHAKMLTTIIEYKDKPEFKKYGIIAPSKGFRRLILYLNLKDNSTAAKISYNAIHLIEHCLPQEVRKRNNKTELKSWLKSYSFVKKGLALINKMAEIGHMDGVKLIPEGLEYEKPSKKFKVSINRKRKFISHFKSKEDKG